MKRLLFAFLALTFLLSPALHAVDVEEIQTDPITVRHLTLIFSKFNYFEQFKEVKDLIQKNEEVISLTPRTATSSFLEYDLQTTEEVDVLYRSFQNQLWEKAWIKRKETPSGLTEIELIAREVSDQPSPENP